MSIVTLIISVVLVVAAFVAVFAGIKHFGPKLFPAKETNVVQQDITIEIPQGSGSSQIAALLVEHDVIASKDEFLKFVAENGDDKKLKPGKYTFREGMDLSEVVAALVAGTQDENKLTLPEGITVQQTAAAVEKSLGIPKDEFLKQAKASNYEAEYPFLKGAYNDSLEGYLFPKTYNFDEQVTADEVIRRLLDQFVKETEGLNFAENPAGLSEQQVITLASLIERETKVETERPRVASVIYNRLKKDMLLQVDAAVVYALGGDKQRLTKEDLKVDSPYNIYVHKGLPPGPICSPSLSAIKAALSPEDTNYLYYVLTSKDGSHTFTEDYDSFLQAKEVYKKEFGVN